MGWVPIWCFIISRSPPPKKERGGKKREGMAVASRRAGGVSHSPRSRMPPSQPKAGRTTLPVAARGERGPRKGGESRTKPRCLPPPPHSPRRGARRRRARRAEDETLASLPEVSQKPSSAPATRPPRSPPSEWGSPRIPQSPPLRMGSPAGRAPLAMRRARQPSHPSPSLGALLPSRWFLGEARRAVRAPNTGVRHGRRRHVPWARGSGKLRARHRRPHPRGSTRRSHLMDRLCGRGAGQRALDVSASAPCCMPE